MFEKVSGISASLGRFQRSLRVFLLILQELTLVLWKIDHGRELLRSNPGISEVQLGGTSMDSQRGSWSYDEVVLRRFWVLRSKVVVGVVEDVLEA